jgi:heavy metal sensor kinase
MRSLRARLAVWSVLVLAGIVVLLGVFVTLRLRSDLGQRVDRSLDAGAIVLRRSFGSEGSTEFRNTSNAVLGAFPYQPAASQILDLKGNVVAGHGPQAEQPMISGSDLESVLSGGQLLVDRNLGGRSFRVWAREVHTRRGDYVLVLAQSLTSVDDSVSTLISQLVIGGIGALLAAGLAGWWLARRALRPVAQMSSAADRITVDRMSERIAEPSSGDELGQLAATLNRMLDRVEQGVEEKRRLVADASHELRTPLAVMRSELDVSLREGDLDGEARMVLLSAREEVDRMTRIVENLLTLARVDEGRLRVLPSPVGLRGVASGAIESLSGVASARKVSVSLADEDAQASGDPELLRQVVSNLVDNAIKYNDEGGQVGVRVWSANGEAGVTVTDSGPGIPAGARDRIFDRFYRVDAARGREGGSGLGLAICKEIVVAHGGRIWVQSDDGDGSSFSFAVPVPAREAA